MTNDEMRKVMQHVQAVMGDSIEEVVDDIPPEIVDLLIHEMKTQINLVIGER